MKWTYIEMHKAFLIFKTFFLGWIPSIVITKAERAFWHIEIE